MSADTAPIDQSSAAGKLRLLSVEDLDGRTRAARRARSLVDQIEGDCGGADRMTAAQRQLAQRAAIMGAFLEDMETTALAGGQIDLPAYLALTNAQRRVLVNLGLSPRPRQDATPAAALRRLRGAA